MAEVRTKESQKAPVKTLNRAQNMAQRIRTGVKVTEKQAVDAAQSHEESLNAHNADSLESKVKNKVIVLVLKLILFNIAAVAAFFFTSFVLSISPEEYTIFGFYVPYMFLILGNIVFLLYDKALSVLVVYYVKVLSPKLFRNRKM